LGFGSFAVTNIFAYRATDPKVMRAVADPVGPQNDAAILQMASEASRVICAWGTHGLHLGRGAKVEALLRQRGVDLYHLGLSKGGLPKHPLYIGYETQPVLWA
jgi:hypothetical protein